MPQINCIFKLMIQHQSLNIQANFEETGRNSPLCTPDIYSSDPRIQIDLTYLLQFDSYRKRCKPRDYRQGVWHRVASSLAPQGKCPDHLLIERKPKARNLSLPSKCAFKYPSWGFLMQARSIKEKCDKESPSKPCTQPALELSLCVSSPQIVFPLLAVRLSSPGAKK